MYVSDPRVWKSFYKNMMDGKFDPHRYRGRQKGGAGIGGLYTKKPYMIPVDPHVTREPEEEKVVVGKQVTPVAAAEERAKSELKDAVKEKVPHVSVKKTIKAKKRARSLSSKKSVKRTISRVKHKKKKRSNNNKPKRKKQKKTVKRRKASKRRTATEEYNIFHKKARI